MDSDAMDCGEAGAPKDGGSGLYNFKGQRRFMAAVMAQTIHGSRYVAEYARKYPCSSLERFSRNVEEKLLNGCASWIWLNGRGNRDFTFEDASWSVGWDPDWVREKVLSPYGEVGDINKWVDKRASGFGPLWED